MQRYLGTFVKGVESIIEPELQRRFQNLKIHFIEDGFVVFSTDSSADEVTNAEFFYKIFYVFEDFYEEKTKTLESMISWTKKNSLLEFIKRFSPVDELSFRIVFSKPNINQKQYSKVISELSNDLVQKSIFIDEAHPDFEICFKEFAKFGIIGIELKTSYEFGRIFQKDSLDLELISVLNIFSEITANDTFLDPFCGNGGIPIQRAIAGNYEKIIASDLETDAIKLKLQRMEMQLTDFEVVELDARKLSKIEDETIDKIVTDPPWGEFYSIEDPETFHDEVFNQFNRVLKKTGTIVIVSSQSEKIDEAITKNKFDLIVKINITIAGKNAYIYKLKKLIN